MILAIKIVKESGMQALEKEIASWNKTGINIDFKEGDRNGSTQISSTS